MVTSRVRTFAVRVTLIGLCAGIGVPPSPAAPIGAHLEGRVLDVSGRPAAGYRVHLIDGDGAPLAGSTTDRRGGYAFSGLDEGRYALGVETPGGRIAPVATPPIALATGQLARRDVRLMASDPTATHSALAANHGLKIWWVSLPDAGKAWVIIGLVAVAGVTYAAVSDDEPPASPILP